MKNISLKGLTIMAICSMLWATGCQPAENEAGGDAATRSLGKGTSSIYRNQAVQDQDAPERAFLRGFLERGNEGRMGRGRGLGRGTEQGTRMGRDQNPYGFCNLSSNDPFAIQAGYGASSYIDRQVLADAIGHIIVGLPHVDEASVIVTDQDCIIGYAANEQGEEVRNQVEMSGLSVTPRWFKVYATDDIELVRSIEDSTRTEGREKRKQLDQHVQQIIQQLGGPKNSWDQQYIPNMDAESREQDEQRQEDQLDRQGRPGR